MKPALEQNAKSQLILLLFVQSASEQVAKMAIIQKCAWCVRAEVKHNK
jgi:hypothetical protein